MGYQQLTKKGLVKRAFYEIETRHDKKVKLRHYAVSNCYLAKQI